jgi:hypothetical protein
MTVDKANQAINRDYRGFKAPMGEWIVLDVETNWKTFCSTVGAARRLAVKTVGNEASVDAGPNTWLYGPGDGTMRIMVMRDISRQ